MSESPSHRDLTKHDFAPATGDRLCALWAGPRVGGPAFTPIPDDTAPPVPADIAPAPADADVTAGEPTSIATTAAPSPSTQNFEAIAKLVDTLRTSELPASIKLAVLDSVLDELMGEHASVVSGSGGTGDVFKGHAHISAEPYYDNTAYITAVPEFPVRGDVAIPFGS